MRRKGILPFVCAMCLVAGLSGCSRKDAKKDAGMAETTATPEITGEVMQTAQPEMTVTTDTPKPKKTKKAKKKKSTPSKKQSVKSIDKASKKQPRKTPSKEESPKIKKIKVPAVVQNDGEKDVVEMYMSVAGQKQWGDELLKGRVLRVGEKIGKIKFMTEPDNLRWDIKLVYADGKKGICHELDVSECGLEKLLITLLLDEEGNPIATVSGV